MIVKPATQGSSVGHDQGRKGRPVARRLPGRRAARAQRVRGAWITGGEYTVAVLQGRALPSIRIETPATFYDYQAKYFRTDTKYHCPSGLSAEAEKHLANLVARHVRRRWAPRAGAAPIS